MSESTMRRRAGVLALALLTTETGVAVAGCGSLLRDGGGREVISRGGVPDVGLALTELRFLPEEGARFQVHVLVEGGDPSPFRPVFRVWVDVPDGVGGRLTDCADFGPSEGAPFADPGPYRVGFSLPGLDVLPAGRYQVGLEIQLEDRGRLVWDPRPGNNWIELSRDHAPDPVEDPADALDPADPAPVAGVDYAVEDVRLQPLGTQGTFALVATLRNRGDERGPLAQLDWALRPPGIGGTAVLTDRSGVLVAGAEEEVVGMRLDLGGIPADEWPAAIVGRLVVRGVPGDTDPTNDRFEFELPLGKDAGDPDRVAPPRIEAGDLDPWAEPPVWAGEPGSVLLWQGFRNSGGAASEVTVRLVPESFGELLDRGARLVTDAAIRRSDLAAGGEFEGSWAFTAPPEAWGARYEGKAVGTTRFHDGVSGEVDGPPFEIPVVLELPAFPRSDLRVLVSVGGVIGGNQAAVAEGPVPFRFQVTNVGEVGVRAEDLPRLATTLPGVFGTLHILEGPLGPGETREVAFEDRVTCAEITAVDELVLRARLDPAPDEEALEDNRQEVRILPGPGTPCQLRDAGEE